MMSATLPTGEQLNRACSNAGVDAQDLFAQAVRLAHPRLLRLARQWVGDADQAQDIVQQALLGMWERGEVKEHTMHALCVAVINQCKYFKSSEHVEQTPSPVVIALRCLPDSDRQALELHFMEGRTISETACILGLPRGELYWSIRRSLSTLKRLLHA